MPESAPTPARRLAPDTRRGEILRHARHAFAESRYSEVALTQLAERAGVSQSLINHYFGTKRLLFLEVVRDAVTVPSFAVGKIVDGPMDVRVRDGVRQLLSSIERNKDIWFRTLNFGLHGTDPEVENILDEADRVAAGYLAAAVGFDVDDQRHRRLLAAIRAFGGMVKAATKEWLVRETLDRDLTEDLLVDALLSVIERVLLDEPQ
ncbi:MAG: TetR/AcrR family transcriptional regulator [Rhodococcus sp. (in: high G+C Gram-positive bacteria)]|uniref:TetR/AcrR family transcriptional regulator n=1 Tax=Rhodococcus sp. TaxID=1831 RepID=UPI002AD7CC07|nr:TetR/AcrR family transcriptional regulator [Rhodococcus sp. (in: high G+C Gram-positive bacteria)]